jgi:preprotein translocase subunit YajC
LGGGAERYAAGFQPPSLPLQTMLPNALLPVIAFLQETPPAEGGEEASSPNFLLPMLAIGAIFWFVMIAPERKRRKQREAMISALKKGDKVMTTSGMHGTVTQVQGDIVTLQIADNVRVKFALAAVQGLPDAEAKKKAATAKGSEKQKTLEPHKGDSQTEEVQEDEVVESK